MLPSASPARRTTFLSWLNLRDYARLRKNKDIRQVCMYKPLQLKPGRFIKVLPGYTRPDERHRAALDFTKISWLSQQYFRLPRFSFPVRR
jgi:hypothetical protein